MGCGSSAAVRLAALALASHFGDLDWSRERILAEAARLEGHPDNAAACWLGGFVASAVEGRSGSCRFDRSPCALAGGDRHARPAYGHDGVPRVLPESYTRKDVVANLQRVALLTAAFAAEDADVLATAMADRLHQPFRAEVCPLLPSPSPAGRERWDRRGRSEWRWPRCAPANCVGGGGFGCQESGSAAAGRTGRGRDSNLRTREHFMRVQAAVRRGRPLPGGCRYCDAPH